jgi:hypothetical protein
VNSNSNCLKPIPKLQKSDYENQLRRCYPGKDSQHRTGQPEHDSQAGEPIINNKINALINGHP